MPVIFMDIKEESDTTTRHMRTRAIINKFGVFGRYRRYFRELQL